MAEDFETLRRRLKHAEDVIKALQDEEVDAVVGRRSIALLRLREVEKELRESEARLRTLVEHFPFEFWALGVDGRYIAANPASEAVWGPRVGKTPEEVAPSPEILRRWQANNARACAGVCRKLSHGWPTGWPKHTDSGCI
jgi:PAS domain-containing protein